MTTKKGARTAGVEAGEEAARNCEVAKVDKAQACCDCDPDDDSEFCALCLSVAAAEAEQNARQYAGHVGFEFNREGERAEGLWDAYDEGVARGIDTEGRKRIKEQAGKYAAARACLAEQSPRLGLGGLTAVARVAEQVAAGEVGPAEVETFLDAHTGHEENRRKAHTAHLTAAAKALGMKTALGLMGHIFGAETVINFLMGPPTTETPDSPGAQWAGAERCDDCPHPVGDHDNV